MPDNTECGMRHSQFQTFHRSRSRMIHNRAILKKPLLKSLCTFPEIMCQPSLSGQLACTEWRSKLSGKRGYAFQMVMYRLKLGAAVSFLF